MFRRLSALIALLGIVSYGCSLVDAPEEANSGMVSFRLVRSDAQSYAARGESALAMALPASDSIQVDVYGPTGDTPQVSGGWAIPLGRDTMEVQLSVPAEQNKRVSVKLFTAGSLQYWGVDQNVDVVAGSNTRVLIQAQAFGVGALWVNPARVWHNEAFDLMWNRVEGASSYHVQESPVANFSVITWENVVTDTMISGPVPAGDYYFRVRALNPYVQSNWRTTALHVGGAPVVSGMSANEVIRGATVDIDIFGADLDHASTQATVFGRMATVLTASPTQLTVRAQPPANAVSDVVTVSNNFGSDASSNLVKVQTIAYLMGTVAGGDWTSANYYDALIESFGDGIDQGGVAVIPYDLATVIVDWGVFDVVVIGADTGTDNSTWAGGGGDADKLAIDIDAGGASVLGLGRGGAAYFEIIGRDIGFGNCLANFQNTAVVMNPGSAVYSKPNVLGVANGQTITMYTNVPLLLSADLTPLPPPPGVTFFARRASLETLFPLVEQAPSTGGLGFLWGFEAVPSAMTATGVAVFENTVVYLYGAARP